MAWESSDKGIKDITDKHFIFSLSNNHKFNQHYSAKCSIVSNKSWGPWFGDSNFFNYLVGQVDLLIGDKSH